MGRRLIALVTNIFCTYAHSALGRLMVDVEAGCTIEREGRPMTEGASIYGRSRLINPAAPAGSLEAKFADPNLGAAILTDQKKYFSPAYMRREWDNLWSRTWNLAGRVSDLAAVGDYFKFDLGRESFVIVRAAPDRVRAFYNVCQHRGARIIYKDFGHANDLTCSFHSWSWNLDGSLKRITDRETFDEAAICDNPGLVEVKCDTWGGFVFINLDPNAPPLMKYLDVLPDHLRAYRFDEMMIVSDATAEWPANWKIALDAFMEGYHVHKRHPEVLGYMDDYHCQADMFANGHGRLLFPMAIASPRRRDEKSLTQELRELLREAGLIPADFEGRADEVRPAIQEAKRQWAARMNMDYSAYTDSQLTDDWNYSIFPNVTFNIHLETALMMRFRPHPTDPEKCFYDVCVLARKVTDPDFRLPGYMGLPDNIDLSRPIPRPQRVYMKYNEGTLGPVVDQDAETVPLVQQGVCSQAFQGVRLSRQEVRMRHFYAEYDRYVGTVPND